jgi:hypothetical protein
MVFVGFGGDWKLFLQEFSPIFTQWAQSAALTGFRPESEAHRPPSQRIVVNVLHTIHTNRLIHILLTGHLRALADFPVPSPIHHRPPGCSDLVNYETSTTIFVIK